MGELKEQAPLLAKDGAAASDDKPSSAVFFILYYALCSGARAIGGRASGI